METMKNKEPVLVAIEVYGQGGYYNVWRYDTPSTQCILFCYKADSEDDALMAARAEIACQN